MNLISEILEWLATVEPGRCKHDSSGYDPNEYTLYLPSGEDYYADRENSEYPLCDAAVVEAVLREAIKARGWCRATFEFGGQKCAEVFTREDEGYVTARYLGWADTDVLALARAYREALST